MAARKVCWRGWAVRWPWVKSAKRAPSVLVSRAAICSTGSTLTRAAASSIAKGMPSRRVQISMTAGAFAKVSWKLGWTAVARSKKSRMHSNCSRRSVNPISCGSGKLRVGTGQSVSPVIFNASRLVVNSCKLGQRLNKVVARWATASMRCSQLSMTSNMALSPTKLAMASRTGTWGAALIPSARATARTTCASSVRAANSTHQTPWAKRSIRSVATWIARRVLPLPPAPLRVSRRAAWGAGVSSRFTAVIAAVRPTKLVSGMGKLVILAAAPPSAPACCLIHW